jgi:hypothetical protein
LSVGLRALRGHCGGKDGHAFCGGVGCCSLLGAALAGYEDADAFDHLGGGACALRQEDVGADGAVEGVDGAGDDHGRDAGVKLLGAADKLIAIHLWHEEVAEEQVDAAGDGALYVLEGFVGRESADDPVAAGFEEEGTDGEDLFVVVDAEDGLLGAHAYSVLPQTALWRVRRMGQPAVSAGLRAMQAGAVETCPMGQQKRGCGTCKGGCTGARRRKETRLSCLLPEGAVPPVPASKCWTMGCEKGRCGAGCHAAPGSAGDRQQR